MKKSIALFLSLLLIAVSVTCVASGVDLSSLTDDQLMALQSEVTTEIAARRGPDDGVVSGQLGKYTVAIKDARLGKDYSGNDVIIITYDWSHQESEAQTFMWSFTYTAYQDGIELESAYVVDGMNDAAMTSIKSGVTLEVETAFLLRNFSSPVEIEVKELISFSSDKVEKTFQLPL